MTGCGGDNNGTQDAGPDATPTNDGGGTDAKTDAATDGGGSDASQDTNLPDHTVVPDAGPDVDVVIPKCATPTFNPMAGAITSGTTVAISSAMLPSDGFIFYTTDGTLPTHASPAYSGPIQVTQAETIRALAFAQGECEDSTIASASYTVTTVVPEGGTAPTVPVFAPPSQTSDNNFSLTLTSTAGATICYTTDGSMPSCNTTASTAACSGTSVAYSGGAGGLMISPAITNAVTGQVSVSALACAAGAGSSAVATQQYTLKAATPTMTNPAPGAVTWTSGVQATLASTTNGASLYMTTDGSAPQCGVQSELQTSNPVLVPLKSLTYNVIACKTGFAPSAVATFTYHVTLSAPTLGPAAGTYNTAVSTTVDDTANLGSNDWVCWSQGTAAAIVTPSCGATLQTCGMGSTLLNPFTNGLGTVAITADLNEVKAISCSAANLTQSAVATAGPYTLKLSAPYVSPSTLAFPNTSPATSYSLTAATTMKIGQTGTNVVTADHACYVKNPATGVVPACMDAGCATGTAIALGAATGPTFVAGDSIAAILCPNVGIDEPSSVVTVQFVGTGTATLPAFSPPDSTILDVNTTPVIINQAAASLTACYTTDGSAPTCTAGTCTAGSTLTLDGNATPNLPFTVTAGGSGYTTAPTVTVTDGNGNTCTAAATVSGGAVTAIGPGSGGGSCATVPPFVAVPSVTIASGSGATATASVTQTIAVTITNGGSGYAANTTTVALADGGGTCAVAPNITVNGGGAVTGITLNGCTGFSSSPRITIGGAGTNATATATLMADEAVVVTVTANGTGYNSAPTVVLTGGGGTCTTAATVALNGTAVDPASVTNPTGCTGYTSNPTVSFTGGGVGAMATVLPSNMGAINMALNTDGTTVTAVTCNAGLAANANPATATYGFTLDDPTFTPNGGVVTPGTNITVATTSNFADTQIVFTTDGTTPACPATPGTPTGSSVNVPATFTTGTVKAIACGANQVASGVVTKAFTPTLQTPTIAATVGATTLPTTSAQNGPLTATITSPTAGTYLCYQLGGVPACSTTTVNGCSVNSTKANSGVQVAISNSGSNLQAVACSPGGTLSSAVVNNTYTLYVTPVNFGAATATCGGTTTVGFSSTAASLTQDATEGGPTTGATVCYSQAAFTWNCANIPPTVSSVAGIPVTCFTPTTAAPTQTVTIHNPTLFAQSCLTGFTGQAFGALTQQETNTTFTVPVNVDGTLGAMEWSATGAALSDLFASGGITGGFTPSTLTGLAEDGATALGDGFAFSTSGFTPAAGTAVVIYTSDDTTSAMTNSTTGPTALGGSTLPFAAHFAIAIDTAASTVGGMAIPDHTAQIYVFSGGAWQAPVNVNDNNIGGTLKSNVIEFGVSPVSALTTSGTLNVAGAVVTGVGGAPTVTGQWPQVNGNWGFVSDVLTSCQNPLAQVQ